MSDEKNLTISDPMGRMYALSQFNDFFTDIHDSFWQRFDALWDNWNLNMKAFDELQPKGSFPKVNVLDNPANYEVEIAIAGFDKDDVELELKENTLFIKADKKEECTNEDECKKYLTKEIAQRSFRRVINFPADVNSEDISAKYENGIIKCTIGKMEVIKPDSVKIDVK